MLQDVYHKDNLRLTVEQWIDQSVIAQCLSQQLSCIENNIDLLDRYYNSKNFIEKKNFLFFLLLLLFSAEWWNRHSYEDVF